MKKEFLNTQWLVHGSEEKVLDIPMEEFVEIPKIGLDRGIRKNF